MAARTARCGGSADARVWAYECVRAVLYDDREHNRDHERACAAGNVVAAVLDESGVDGLADVAVDLSLRLASALERVAAEQGVTAVDLADAWFMDRP